MLRNVILGDILPMMSRTRTDKSVIFTRRSFAAISRRKQITTAMWMEQHANYLHRCQHHLAHEEQKGGKSVTPDPSPPSSVVSRPGVLKKKQSLFNFVYSRFLRFLDRYQKIIGTKFPGAMNVYNVFVNGFKDFTIETKDYVVLQRRILMSSTKVTELSRKEVDLYFRMPGEILRVGPTLLISALPFANYIVFPIAYHFPKNLLSSHFWTNQQKAQFALEFHKEKLVNYRPVFHQLQFNVLSIQDVVLRRGILDVLHQLSAGTSPSIREILDLKRLFTKERYSLKAIHGPHVKSLCRAHGIRRFFLKRMSLYDRAEMLRSMDSVLARDGISELKTDELQTACFLRGLNASNLDNNEMAEYLEKWLTVSQELESPSNSLLVHLPILLAYNHPQNCELLNS